MGAAVADVEGVGAGERTIDGAGEVLGITETDTEGVGDKDAEEEGLPLAVRVVVDVALAVLLADRLGEGQLEGLCEGLGALDFVTDTVSVRDLELEGETVVEAEPDGDGATV